jgi:O-antigen ligase
MLLWWYPIDASEWVKALKVHFVLAFAICLFAAYQLAARAFDLPLAWIEITNASYKKGAQDPDAIVQLALSFSNFYRATSIFSEPSSLAIYAGMNLSMLLAAFFRGTRSIIRSQWFFVASMLVAVLAMFLAFSLTGIMVVGVTLVLLSILYGTAALRRLLPFLLIIIAVIGIADRVVNSIVDVSVLELFSTRIESLVTGKAQAEESGAIVGESVTQRTGDYRVSFEAWQEAPVMGVGPGNFGNSVAARYYNSRYPSTTYGSVLSELGIVGLVILVLFFTTMLRESLRVGRSSVSDTTDTDILTPVLSVIALIVIFVAFNSNLLVSAYFWLYAALVCSGISAADRQAGTEHAITIGMHPLDPHAAHH